MFDGQGGGISDEGGQFERGEHFGADEFVDAEVLPIGDFGGFAVDDLVNACHGACGAEFSGDGGADEIGFVMAGDGDEEVGLLDADASEDFGRGSGAVDDVDIEVGFDESDLVRVAVDDGDVVAIACDPFGNVPADFTGAGNDDFHGYMFPESVIVEITHAAARASRYPWYCRRFPLEVVVAPSQFLVILPHQGGRYNRFIDASQV